MGPSGERVIVPPKLDTRRSAGLAERKKMEDGGDGGHDEEKAAEHLEMEKEGLFSVNGHWGTDSVGG